MFCKNTVSNYGLEKFEAWDQTIGLLNPMCVKCIRNQTNGNC